MYYRCVTAFSHTSGPVRFSHSADPCASRCPQVFQKEKCRRQTWLPCNLSTWDLAHVSGRKWSLERRPGAITADVFEQNSCPGSLGLKPSPLSMPMTSPVPRSPGQSVAPEASLQAPPTPEKSVPLSSRTLQTGPAPHSEPLGGRPRVAATRVPRG